MGSKSCTAWPGNVETGGNLKEGQILSILFLTLTTHRLAIRLLSMYNFVYKIESNLIANLKSVK